MLTILDIETGPAPAAELEAVMPQFKSPANYKKPEAIAEYVAQAKSDWIERAALSAVTGRVLCVGMTMAPDLKGYICEDNEKGCIEHTWGIWLRGDHFVGWNLKGFDLPFLVRRSWALGVKVPPDLMEGRWWSQRVIDLMELWSLTNRDQRESLDTVAKALGVGAKNGHGADFARLWAEDRDKARAYLLNDLSITAKIAQRMGVA